MTKIRTGLTNDDELKQVSYRYKTNLETSHFYFQFFLSAFSLFQGEKIQFLRDILLSGATLTKILRSLCLWKALTEDLLHRLN